MDKQTLTFTLERETKNTIRYQEDSNGKPPSDWHPVRSEVVTRQGATSEVSNYDR